MAAGRNSLLQWARPARAVARFYGALANNGTLDGVSILSLQAVKEAGVEHAFGQDEVLRVTTRFGLGFMLTHQGQRLGPHGRAFGHPGMGGSLGFGYVMNRSQSEILLDGRPAALIRALYTAL